MLDELTGGLPAAQIYMVQNNIQRWSFHWFYLQACLSRRAPGHRLLRRRTATWRD